MSPELKAIHDARKAERREAETEIVWQHMNKAPIEGPHIKPSLSGGMEMNLKYLKFIMPFFSERTIQLSLYALQAQSRITFTQDKGFGCCLKWYRVR